MTWLISPFVCTSISKRKKKSFYSKIFKLSEYISKVGSIRLRKITFLPLNTFKVTHFFNRIFYFAEFYRRLVIYQKLFWTKVGHFDDVPVCLCYKKRCPLLFPSSILYRWYKMAIELAEYHIEKDWKKYI